MSLHGAETRKNSTNLTAAKTSNLISIIHVLLIVSDIKQWRIRYGFYVPASFQRTDRHTHKNHSETFDSHSEIDRHMKRTKINHLCIVCWVKFFYNKPFLLYVYTWTGPNRNRSAVHTPFLFRVLPGRPPDCRHGMFSNTCPVTLIISPPSFLFPPLSLHVPRVSHSPHAKNRCDNIIGASGRTQVRLDGKHCWGSLQ
jgi:hypothetical protein